MGIKVGEDAGVKLREKEERGKGKTKNSFFLELGTWNLELGTWN
jgi:hypothetical protein